MDVKIPLYNILNMFLTGFVFLAGIITLYPVTLIEVVTGEVLIRYNKFRKKKRHGLQKSGRMKLRHAILKGDNKPCPKRLYS